MQMAWLPANLNPDGDPPKRIHYRQSPNHPWQLACPHALIPPSADLEGKTCEELATIIVRDPRQHYPHPGTSDFQFLLSGLDMGWELIPTHIAIAQLQQDAA